MIKRSLVAVVFGASALLAAPAMAQHSDIELGYGDGQIILAEPEAGFFVFESEFPESGLFARETDDPGFAADEPGEGFILNADDFVGYNVLDNLFLWNGTEFTSPGSATITITNLLDEEVFVDAASGMQTSSVSDPLSQILSQADSNGVLHDHLEFELSDGAPTGAYGLLMSLSTSADGIGDSDPFGILFNFGLSEDDFENGVDAFGDIVAPAPIPLPGAVLLLGSALLLLVRRRNR